jgi:hypothetical protein
MSFEAFMAGVTQRIVFLVITLCRKVSEQHRVCTIKLIFVQVETTITGKTILRNYFWF